MSEPSLLERPTRIGPYRVLRRLGVGGMAEAYEGVREGPGGFVQRVCVKRVRPSFGGSRELERLFLREARLAAALSHRNITAVVDFGEDGGAQYLALELVDGMDLRALLRGMPGRRLPAPIAVLVAVEIAEALEHAHTRRGATGTVVHRDVSPANILISEDGDVKLTDFGISKALGDVSLTRSGLVRGNVWYMAPELLRPGVAAEPTADLFSLGVVLYEALSGRRPYQARTHAAAMIAAAEGRHVHLRLAAHDLPEPIYGIVERLMAFAPAERFDDAGSLIDALAPLTGGSSERRALRDLVREARREPEASPIPEVATLVDAEVAAPERADQNPRWQPYVRGPRAWADAEHAAKLRRPAIEPTRILPADAPLPRLPSVWSSPAGRAARLLSLLLGVVLCCAIARLLSG